ncbi:helix-turn-helix domain-containing protein [Muricoccus radiodurans]|uniref:helix-turn-helix domain-containing protein n=1 Tax=Muricoccus radiodurans TaxID=2231721 RepID=UPI003CEBBEA7
MTPNQLRVARALLRLSRAQLRLLAKVSESTIAKIEKDPGAVTPQKIIAIRTALEAAGVEFLEDDSSGLGVRLKKAHSAL